MTQRLGCQDAELGVVPLESLAELGDDGEKNFGGVGEEEDQHVMNFTKFLEVGFGRVLAMSVVCLSNVGLQVSLDFGSTVSHDSDREDKNGMFGFLKRLDPTSAFMVKISSFAKAVRLASLNVTN